MWNFHACVPSRHRTTWHYEVGIEHQAKCRLLDTSKVQCALCKAVVVKKYSLKASAEGRQA